MPYWRLSSFYLFYYASVGVLLPYWGLYLQSLGFSPREIGEMVAILFATRVVAPIALSCLSDRCERRMGIVRIASVASFVAFAGVYFLPEHLSLNITFWWLLLVTVLFSFFWNAPLPQIEAITLSHLGDNTHHYGKIRVWGSVGFILSVWFFGQLIDRYSVELIRHGVFVLLIGMATSCLSIPDQGGRNQRHEPESLGKKLRQSRVLALLAASFLMQFMHGPFYAFYSIYLDEYLYDSALIGQLWALGVGAQVAIFLILPSALKYGGLRTLFLSVFALSCLRWLLVALFPSSLPTQIFAQLLHAVIFATYHTVAMLFIHRFFGQSHQHIGQALYSSVSFGAGGAAGALVGGFLWSFFGGEITYLVTAGVGVFTFLIIWRWIDA